jgi:hypothetical protein
VSVSSLLHLIACSDDYLLEESLADAIAEAQAALGGVEPEHLADDITPEAAALELRSPSLFNPQRLLVLADIRGWVTAPKPRGTSGGPVSGADVAPLVDALAEGLPADTGLILGVWCGAEPKGKLVEVIRSHGQLTWIALPAPPKPWEKVEVTEEQRAVLRGVVRRAAPGIRLSPKAAALLLERLGFAPRLLAAEVQKLATAAGRGATIDETLVRQLTFPRERSLEVVQDAILERDARALFDLVATAAAGRPLRDWQGQRLEPSRLPLLIVSQVANLLEQMLYVRRLARQAGLADQLSPARTSASRWYQRVFREGLAPPLLERIADDADSPLGRQGKAPSQWHLGRLFAGAGRYREKELVSALIAAGELERRTRGPLALEAITSWLSETVIERGA